MKLCFAVVLLLTYFQLAKLYLEPWKQIILARQLNALMQ
jgi:hypothetical protein